MEQQKQSNIKTTIDDIKDMLAKEVWSRNEISYLSSSKLKEIDSILAKLDESNELEGGREAARIHLEEHHDSNMSKYFIGIIGLMTNRPEDTTFLRAIMDQFRDLQKWQLLVHTAQKMLDFGNNRYALRAIVDGMDHGSYPKSKIKPFYEKLAKLDRKNPDIAEKYGRSLIEEGDNEAGLKFIKQATEAYARGNNLDKLGQCWRYLVDQSPEDIKFFEKIERILINNRQLVKASELLMQFVDFQSNLLTMAIDTEKVEILNLKIFLLKKVLEHNPHYHKARMDIVSTFKDIYADHSLLKEFLQHSGLTNNRKDVNVSISEFEKNIVFDKGNYVAHKNWGVGKIIDLNQNEITIDFKSKTNHLMSIQMALKSLKALPKGHIWVKYHENENEMKELFKEAPVDFFVEMLNSYGNIIVMNEIKNEVIDNYLSPKDWSKWWSKIKTQLKKHPHIGFSPRKKDEIFFREEKISLAEELSEKFSASKDHNKKLDIAMEAMDDLETCQDAVDSFVSFYNQEEKSKTPINQIIAFFYLKIVTEKTGDEESHSLLSYTDIQEIIKDLTIDKIVSISSEIKNLEIKKEFLMAIKVSRDDYTEIFTQVLFEVPIKIHKYIFSELVKEEKFDTINDFVNTTLHKLKDAPEVFLWVSKNILNEQWNYDWLKVQFHDVVLRVFRLLRPLGKIEKTGTKLKKMAQDIIFGNDSIILKKTIDESDDSTIRKLAALFKEVPYIEDSQKNKLIEFINSLRPNFKWHDDDEESNASSFAENYLTMVPSDEVIIVSRASLERKEKEYDQLVNIEMVENSEDIGKAQKLGDLRENAEYKAAMERQQLLQGAMTKMDADFKKVKLIDPKDIQDHIVCIGSRLLLKNRTSNETQFYTILGPWDADSDKRIISYKSPLAQSLIGKNMNDVATYEGSPDEYEILEIHKAVL